jgi:hypothetical protein
MHRQEVDEQLARILASRLFRGSDRSEGARKQSRAAPKSFALLRFLATRALEGKHLSDAIVTQEFFGKEPQTFDRGEAIARVHVGILRKKLTEYYVTDGINDPVSVDIPVGTFVPIFLQRKTSPPDRELERGLYQINAEAPGNIATGARPFR